ncbi:bifunctional 2-dehydro-3-deoxygluconokinase/2-dehydro-3-deoxygalactonokinase [Natrialbaceae archaeon A-CW1-1]
MGAIVTFGETMLRLSPPDQQRLESATTLEVVPGGAESNVAVAAACLGTPATWLSKLPSSPLGRRVVSELRRYGVTVEVVWTESGRQGTYFLERAGQPRGTSVIYDRANAAVTSATADELATESIREAETFLTSGITPALSSTLEQTVGDVLEIAQVAGVQTAFDVNYRSTLWTPAQARDTLEQYFPAIDVLITPARDARNVLERAGDAGTIATDLAEEWDFETVVITCGADGATAYADGTLVERPAFETETIDPIGTGDAFVGGFLASRLEDRSLGTALEYGGAVAALKRTIPGDVAVVTRAEVDRVVEGDHAVIAR